MIRDLWPAAAVIGGLIAFIAGTCALHAWDLNARRAACDAAGGQLTQYGSGVHMRHWCDFGRAR